MRTLRLLVATALLFGSPACGKSRATGTVSGQIFDTTCFGLSCPNQSFLSSGTVTVFAERDTVHPIAQVVASASGFRLNLSPGEYVVKAFVVGRAPRCQPQPVAVRPGKTITVTLHCEDG